MDQEAAAAEGAAMDGEERAQSAERPVDGMEVEGGAVASPPPQNAVGKDEVEVSAEFASEVRSLKHKIPTCRLKHNLVPEPAKICPPALRNEENPRSGLPDGVPGGHPGNLQPTAWFQGFS